MVKPRQQRTFPPVTMAHISPQPLQAEDVQKLLGADETLVFWLVDEKETYVFALTRDGFEWRTIAWAPRLSDCATQDVVLWLVMA